MEKTYCGACRGERGCPDCKKAARSADYTGITEFKSEEASGKAVGLFEKSGHAGEKNDVQRELLLAADIGTTTLAFVCADEKGRVLASYGCGNPQRKTAADVIGRIDSAIRGERENLKNVIREALAGGFLFVLEKGMRMLRETESTRDGIAVRIAMAGNTTMQHLLMGYPVDGMAGAPFIPYSVEGETVSFAALFSKTPVYEKFPSFVRQAEVTIFPCFSAFVGGDLVAGAYALFPGACTVGQTRFLLDLGTNGELLLFADGKIYGTAAAMGSAFEGGRFAYASDLFRLIAEARKQGILDETGLLDEPYFTEGFYGLRQEDVREFQLAKGALRAGIELLFSHAGRKFSDVDKVYIAGGVGRYCRSEDLFCTGLLPEEFAGKVEIVGNSCIGGMLSYLKNREAMLYCKGEMINLAEKPGFEETYYQWMNFV